MAAFLIAHGADVNQLVIEEGIPPRNILTDAVDFDDSDMSFSPIRRSRISASLAGIPRLVISFEEEEA